MEGTGQDKVMSPVVVTGATGSMGAVAVRALASEGRPVIMACRNLEKGERVRSQVLESFPDASIELIRLDLDSRAGVEAFVSELGSRPLAGIFNNAGVISRSYSHTEEGIEHTMAVNFVHPALLTVRLLPLMEKGAHIVNMVSLTTRYATIDDGWDKLGEASFKRLKTYSRTKLAFLLFSVALARHCPELHVNVSDPGVVDSNMITMGKWFDPLADIFFRPFISSPEKGAAPALSALHFNGSLEYFVGKGHRSISSSYLANPMCEKLWEYIVKL